MPSQSPSYSLFGRLLWFPLLSAPVAYTAPGILLPAVALGAFAALLRGKDAGISVGVIVWVIACWFVSFTYRRSERDSTKMADPVRVHLLSPFGYRTTMWTLGTDIDLDQYARHCDRTTGELFVLTVFREGNETMHLLDRAHWLEAKRQMDNQALS